jgi:hypothetical protein
MAKRRLGLLGPIIVLVGAAVAGLGVYAMIHNKPKPGAVVETVVIDPEAKIVVRAEDGGERNFVELHVGGELRWQALVPPYGGRHDATGIAWSDVAVSVRVIRNHKAEVFALALRDSEKLGGIHLGGDHGPIKEPSTGPITLTDHIRSYEIVGGADWSTMTAIDLRNGAKLWITELGKEPITAGGVTGGLVWLEQGGTKRYFRVFSGKEDRSSEATGIPLVPATPAP